MRLYEPTRIMNTDEILPDVTGVQRRQAAEWLNRHQVYSGGHYRPRKETTAWGC